MLDAQMETDMTFQNIERPADIAAAVRRPSALQVAEMKFAKADHRRAEITSQIRVIIASTYGRGDDSGARELQLWT